MKAWPLPALAAWALAWALFLLLLASHAPVWMALLLACSLGAVLSLLGGTRWRRLFIGLGFPLSLLVLGPTTAVPAWVWCLPLLTLLAVYPLRAWRDAPVFPTPRGALLGLGALAPLTGPVPRIVDAGCGLGDGLRELRAEYPQARLDGIEWSWLLRLLCALRCRWLRLPADVCRGDIWAIDWSPYAMVYLFQRPESLPRALDKAARELRPGAWVASLEFEAVGWQPAATLACPDGRAVWLYQVPFMRQMTAGGEKVRGEGWRADEEDGWSAVRAGHL